MVHHVEPVVGAASQQRAVRRERHRVCNVGVARQGASVGVVAPPVGGAPQLHFPIGGAAGQQHGFKAYHVCWPAAPTTGQ
eukprot:9165609-Pyramimonas_sp.AAC.1